MATGTSVYNAALVLADGDSAEYPEAKAISLINILGQTLYQISDTKAVTAGSRPIFTSIEALTETLDLDDGLAIGVLPYGIASHFLMGEDDVKANTYLQLYQEGIQNFKNSPQEFEDIEDVYGTTEE